MAFIHGDNSGRAGMVSVRGAVVISTGKAILLEGDGKRTWLPRHFVIVEDVGAGVSEVTMRRWLAKAKGFV